jgi:GTPase SAR1 family protein
MILLGDSGVGKSSIATRFSKDVFKEDYEVTIGGSYFQNQIVASNGTVKLHI